MRLSRCALALVLLLIGCERANVAALLSEDDAGTHDAATSLNPARTAYGEWLKVEPEGAVCSDGSPYKFFVNYSRTSDNVLVVFEPGGACWDWESCAQNTGIRGAANPNGIPDNHMALWGVHTPLLLRRNAFNPVLDWNFIFVPYCTGDVHTGNRVATYEPTAGDSEPLVFHHKGHDNNLKIVNWVDQQFPSLPKLFMAGCSAGGVGSQVNYWFYRNALSQVNRAYLLNDSGPVFPDSGNSGLLHTQIRQAWNIDSVLDELPSDFNRDDFGSINTYVADAFPNDRLAITYFRRDFNFSVYSYERFYDNPPKNEIMRLWWQDTQLLTAQYDSRPNLSYYLPYYRELNDSHCAMILGWNGTEIEESSIDLEQYVRDLLNDDKPLQSYLESVQPSEDGTDVSIYQ